MGAIERNLAKKKNKKINFGILSLLFTSLGQQCPIFVSLFQHYLELHGVEERKHL